MKKTFLILSVAVILAVVAGCAGPPPTTPPGATGEPGLAMVDSVDVRLLESFPLQVQLVARGNLPDGCTQIDQTSVKNDGNAFSVQLTTRRTTAETCTQALAPFEQVIPLDVAGLAAGTYTVDVNGVPASFTFDVDNALPGATEPAGTGEDVEIITWAEAEELILGGQVKQVVQAHSLTVRLTLHDGRLVETTEPAIDDIFALIQQCGAPCANILQATE